MIIYNSRLHANESLKTVYDEINVTLMNNNNSSLRIEQKSIKQTKINFFGEFDPGSGLTLAACLIHASRMEELAFPWRTGE